MRDALAGQTSDERAQARRLARMMEDPRGKELTIALTDQAFRSRRPERIADQIAYLLDRYGAPRFMEWWERVGLILGGVMAHYLPSVVVPRSWRGSATRASPSSCPPRRTTSGATWRSGGRRGRASI